MTQGVMPVAGAIIAAATNSPAAPSTTTDPAGNYTLKNLSGGPANITATLPAMPPMPPMPSMTKTVNIEAGKTATLNFDF